MNEDTTRVYEKTPDDQLKAIANSYHPVPCYTLLCDILGKSSETEQCVRWLRECTVETGRRMRDALATLTQRERTVLERRYGLTDSTSNHETLQSLADSFGVTRERIRQIEKRAIKKLRHPTRIRKLLADETFGTKTESGPEALNRALKEIWGINMEEAQQARKRDEAGSGR